MLISGEVQTTSPSINSYKGLKLKKARRSDGPHVGGIQRGVLELHDPVLSTTDRKIPSMDVKWQHGIYSLHNW